MPTLSRRTPEAHATRGGAEHRDRFWPTEWLLWETPPASGLENMAADLALLHRAAETGRAVLRLYDWERPTLSFGRNEVARDRWDLRALESAGIDVIRRPTGGRALLHVHDVTWSVILPLAADVSWRRVYDAVNACLLRALHRVGVGASLVQEADSRRLAPDGPLCFDASGAGELTFHGRKLAGSAVWRADGGYLQHGSILLRNVQHRLTSFRLPTAAADQTLSLRSPSGSVSRTALARDIATSTFHGASADTLREAIRAEWCEARASANGELGDVDTRECVVGVGTAMGARDIRRFKPSTEDIAARDASRQELSSDDWLWRR